MRAHPLTSRNPVGWWALMVGFWTKVNSLTAGLNRTYTHTYIDYFTSLSSYFTLKVHGLDRIYIRIYIHWATSRIELTHIHRLLHVIIEPLTPGTGLGELWARISWITTIRLAFQLRDSVCRLRSLKSSTARSLHSGEYRSFWLDDRYNLPAHSTPNTITSFIDSGTILLHWEKSNLPNLLSRATKSISLQPLHLVFTHHGLAPRNIIVDSRGRLWLLDWGFAGWYPVILSMLLCRILLCPGIGTGALNYDGNFSVGFLPEYIRVRNTCLHELGRSSHGSQGTEKRNFAQQGTGKIFCAVWSSAIKLIVSRLF